MLHHLPARVVVPGPGLEAVQRPPASAAGLCPPSDRDPGAHHGLDLDVSLGGGEHEVRGQVPDTDGREGDEAAEGVNIVKPGPGVTRRICYKNLNSCN